MFGKTVVISVCLLFVGGALAAPAKARRRQRGTQLTERDKLYIEAARALYGVGLKINRGKRSTTIAPRPGGLTQAKYNRYVKEVYLEVLRAYLTRLHGGHWRWKKGGYIDTSGSRGRYRRRSSDPGKWDPRGKIKRAHLLLEPYIKYALCRKIMAAVGDKPNIVVSWKRISWCAMEAMYEAIAPIYEYRGSKVTWKAPADRGNLKLADVIWQPDANGNYPIVVTVRGGGNIYTLASTNILFRLSEDVDRHFAKKMYRTAKALYKKTLKIYHRLVKQIARKQRKLAGRKKVIFGKNRFYATIAQKPTPGPLPCSGVYYLAYGPRR
jgi:hypothetical protein